MLYTVTAGDSCETVMVEATHIHQRVAGGPRSMKPAPGARKRPAPVNAGTVRVLDTPILT